MATTKTRTALQTALQGGKVSDKAAQSALGDAVGRIANLTNQLKEITEPAFTEYSRGVMMLDIKGSQKRTTSG